jgi:hypothetical protein
LVSYYRKRTYNEESLFEDRALMKWLESGANCMIKPRRMRWVGHVARMGEMRNVYRLLVGKPKRKETTRRTSYHRSVAVQLEELGQLENPVTSSGIELATLPACRIVLQPVTLQLAPICFVPVF